MDVKSIMNKKPAKERLFMLIQKEADQEGQWADRLADVAELLGTNRRTVQRALRALEREGKIAAVEREPRKPVRYQLIPAWKGDNEGGSKDSMMSPHQTDYQTLNPWVTAPEARRQDVMDGSASLPGAKISPSALENFPYTFPYGWPQENGGTPKATTHNFWEGTFLGISKDIWVKIGICIAVGGIGALYAQDYSDDPRAPFWGFSAGALSTGLVIYLLDKPSKAAKPSLPPSSTANQDKMSPRGDSVQSLIDQLARTSVVQRSG